MNVLLLLALILFILMSIVGGKKGIRSFLALFLNFGVIFLTILFMLSIKNTIIVTVIACTIISCINLFYINKFNHKTLAAFVSTIITLAVLVLFIFIIEHHAMIQGFGEEQEEEINAFSLYVGIDFAKIAICTIIMGAIGAIIDISLSISSSMNELFIHDPSVTKKNLFNSGLKIGRDILGTTTNTLYFAFVGGYLTLIIWFKRLSYSFGDIINSKTFCAEVISILSGGIGVAIIIPITSWISASIFLQKREKGKQYKEIK
ncbi:YibE/F family protein [Priestia megaterium]|uniref:YibE/F family protein n=1 Tax=Priestia megaterium TaxID=1404 RepID=UPI003009D1A8